MSDTYPTYIRHGIESVAGARVLDMIVAALGVYAEGLMILEKYDEVYEVLGLRNALKEAE